MKLRCKLGIHKWEDRETQRTKNICYGPGSLPGMRLKQICKYCSENRYIKLNLYQPEKDLYKEYLWRTR